MIIIEMIESREFSITKVNIQLIVMQTKIVYKLSDIITSKIEKTNM